MTIRVVDRNYSPVIEEELCVHNSSSVERNVLVDVFPWLPATANEV